MKKITKPTQKRIQWEYFNINADNINLLNEMKKQGWVIEVYLKDSFGDKNVLLRRPVQKVRGK